MGRIQLRSDLYCEVDKQDMALLRKYKWHFKKDPTSACGGYVATNVKQKSGKYKSVTLHKILLSVPDGMQCDHIDRNTLNNKRNNLRIVTPLKNNMNRAGWRKSSSKYKGVSYEADRGLWKAALRIDGKSKNLGRFKTEEEAAEAYDNAVKKHHGSYAFLNMEV